MKIGAIWDAKVIHLNYVLRGKVVVVDDSMLSQDANETTFSFVINDSRRCDNCRAYHQSNYGLRF